MFYFYRRGDVWICISWGTMMMMVMGKCIVATWVAGAGVVRGEKTDDACTVKYEMVFLSLLLLLFSLFSGAMSTRHSCLGVGSYSVVA